MTTRQRKSLAALQRLIRQLSRAADERRAQGRYDLAEPLYLRALSLAELFCGREDVAALCNNLAVLYKYMGRFDEAERLYRRALPLMEQSLGPEHSEIATLYHNLGGLEHARGRFGAGEP
ncbi:MAG TPA: tetratricopeptide repeat protein, partial [Blastocatellia bacterium]|nr:tetratricopeptide repeat protein [Blastocatellia bacterium]